MPAKPPKAFDVWFVAADTVYKAVPYHVVADWAQQGRLARTDKVRPTGTTEAWAAVGESDLLGDYLARPSVATAAPSPSQPETEAEALAQEPVELPDPEAAERAVSRPQDDDEVDMIPLIDISMVLLVFFIMIQAAGALAPVDVPEMRYAGKLTNDPDAVTVTIDKLNTEDVYYSVRVGTAPPPPGRDRLPTPEAALKALNEALAGTTRPPEVRIACNKDLPRERVYELHRELEKLRKKGVINSSVATVVEAPDK